MELVDSDMLIGLCALMQRICEAEKAACRILGLRDPGNHGADIVERPLVLAGTVFHVRILRL